MSYDLAFWYESRSLDAAAAYQKYDAMTDGESGVTAESPRVAEFYRDILRTYQDLTEDTTEEEAHQSPWTSSVYFNGECVLVNIAWSRKSEVSNTLIDMAKSRGLVTYDPQRDLVIEA
ncbi:hypothetical protein SUDANB108_03248 [Streptomyces sp. enrichment culture]|uniref:hypothetical protein n=1 Tax=Streptomyces sp. enrichment culture TaxID=1795815 RepID=UPI003F558001